MEINKTNDVGSTSWFGSTLYASANQIAKALNIKPNYVNDDKTQYEWDLIYNNIPFTIYDWKLEDMLEPNDKINWHIGTNTGNDSKTITKILKEIIYGTNN